MTTLHLRAGLTPSLVAITWVCSLTGVARPDDKPSPRLVRAGDMKCEDQWVSAAAVLDDTRVVVVGTREGGEDTEPDPDKLAPNGAIVDLAKKKASKFTNEHAAHIHSVTTGRGRVVTASIRADPLMRIWDLKAEKPDTSIELDKFGDKRVDYSVAAFHKTDRIVVAADTRLLLYDLKGTGERTELEISDEKVGWYGQPVVGPDDEWVACPTGRCALAYLNMKTKKATVVPLHPEKADPQDWLVHSACFGPKGVIYVVRSCPSETEVPDGKLEKDVGAERRGIVRIDTATGKVEPTTFGHTNSTLCCAVDPTGTWLVTGGSSRLDGDAVKTVSEVRLYNLATSTLAHREQLPFEDLGVVWVSFTPKGDVVCATKDGHVIWWTLAKK